MGRLHLLLAIIAAFGITACTSRTTNDTGSVFGRVTYSGTPRPGGIICFVPNDHFFGGTPRDERFLTSETGGLQNVLVYVSNLVDEAFDEPQAPAQLAMRQGQFQPRVLAVRTGQEVNISAHDNTMHNLAITEHDRQETQAFINGLVMKYRFNATERPITLGCNVHPWMRGYVHVFDHPYHAVTDEEGRFRIDNLPAGDYELTVWHELEQVQPDRRTITVVVKPRVKVMANFEFSRR